MTTDMLTRSSETPRQTGWRPRRRPSPTAATGAGRALQLTWLGYLAFAIWLSAYGPQHPQPPTWIEPLLVLVSWAIMATTVGLLFRRRWALWTSAALCLPIVGLAVMCRLADVGNHWILEAVFAVGITAFTLHPDSWRMHSR